VLGKRTNQLEPDPTGSGEDGSDSWATHVSVICEDMRIVGDCEVDGPVRILGKVSGTVRARTLDLASSGAVEGDVETIDAGDADQVIVITGRVYGAVRGGRVEVRRGGAVLGGIVTDEATIHGRVEGGILARRRLALGETSVVDGDVDALRLTLREGGQVNGRVRMGDRAAIEPSSNDSASRRPVSESSDEEATDQPVGAVPSKGPSRDRRSA
jgi:cytoskeletal protein CcmA (bactofilin family)